MSDDPYKAPGDLRRKAAKPRQLLRRQLAWYGMGVFSIAMLTVGHFPTSASLRSVVASGLFAISVIGIVYKLGFVLPCTILAVLVTMDTRGFRAHQFTLEATPHAILAAIIGALVGAGLDRMYRCLEAQSHETTDNQTTADGSGRS